jgi:hypothetical protein
LRAGYAAAVPFGRERPACRSTSRNGSGEPAVGFGEVVDDPVEIEPVRVDAGPAGLVGQLESVCCVRALEVLPVARGVRGRCRHGGAVGAPEAKRAVRAAVDPVAALVDEAVVVRAEVDEV